MRDADGRAGGYDVEVLPADGLDATGSHEQRFDQRPPRIPTGLVIGVLVVVLAVAVVISSRHPSGLPAPAPTASAAAVQSPAQLALAELQATVTAPVLKDFEIVDNVHPNCPLISVGNAVQVATMTQVVERYQGGFTLQDSELGSELTGVCSATLRFDSPTGATLVVTVLAPPNALTPFAITSITSAGGARDVGTVIDGWRVEVGMVSALDQLIDESALLAVATDARLRW